MYYVYLVLNVISALVKLTVTCTSKGRYFQRNKNMIFLMVGLISKSSRTKFFKNTGVQVNIPKGNNSETFFFFFFFFFLMPKGFYSEWSLF